MRAFPLATARQLQAGLFSLIFLGTAAVWAGNLTPPGEPASTMKSLADTDPGIPIHQGDLPLTISAAGRYYFAENLTFSSFDTDAISVQQDGVEIDLNGFTLAGPGRTAGSTGNGIVSSGSHIGLVIQNGSVRGFRDSAISCQAASHARIEKLASYANGVTGISAGEESIVRECTVDINGGDSEANGIVTGDSSFVIGNHVTNTTASGGANATGISCGEDCTVSGNVILKVTGGETNGQTTGILTAARGTITENSVTACVASGNSTANGIAADDSTTIEDNRIYKVTGGATDGPAAGISGGSVIRGNTIRSVTTEGAGTARGIDASSPATVADNSVETVTSGSGQAAGIKSSFGGTEFLGNHVESVSTSTGNSVVGIAGANSSHFDNNFVRTVIGGTVGQATGISASSNSVVENCHVDTVTGGTTSGALFGILGGTTLDGNTVISVTTAGSGAAVGISTFVNSASLRQNRVSTVTTASGTTAVGMQGGTVSRIVENLITNIHGSGTNATAFGIVSSAQSSVRGNVVNGCVGTGTGTCANIFADLDCEVAGNDVHGASGTSANNFGIRANDDNVLIISNTCRSNGTASISFASGTSGGYAAGNHVKNGIIDSGSNTEGGTNPVANQLF